jgi:hypothetical protein
LFFMKLDIWGFFENPSSRLKFDKHLRTITVAYMKICVQYDDTSLNEPVHIPPCTGNNVHTNTWYAATSLIMEYS